MKKLLLGLVAAVMFASPAWALKLVNHSPTPTSHYNITGGDFAGEFGIGIGFTNFTGPLNVSGGDIFSEFTSGQSNILALYANTGVGGADDALGALLWTKTDGNLASIEITNDFNGRFRRVIGIVDNSFSGNIVSEGSTTWGGVGLNTSTYTNIAPIPEPSTWIMMILGFGFVAMRLQKRRTVAAAA